MADITAAEMQKIAKNVNLEKSMKDRDSITNEIKQEIYKAAENGLYSYSIDISNPETVKYIEEHFTNLGFNVFVESLSQKGKRFLETFSHSFNDTVTIDWSKK